MLHYYGQGLQLPDGIMCLCRFLLIGFTSRCTVKNWHFAVRTLFLCFNANSLVYDFNNLFLFLYLTLKHLTYNRKFVRFIYATAFQEFYWGLVIVPIKIMNLGIFR